MADYNLSVIISGTVKGLQNAVDQAIKITGNLGGTLQNVGGKMKAFGQQGLVQSAVITAGFTKMVEGSKEFESNMRKATVLTNGNYDQLKQSALEMAKSSVYSTGEVANAMAELGAKGFDMNQTIQATPGILAAAAASGEDLALVSETISSALNAFHLKAEDSNHVADVLAQTANLTAAGVEDLGYAFKYAAPSASALGISMEELATATGIMVDQGMKGQQAGTTLRQAFVSLAKPTSEAKRLME